MTQAITTGSLAPASDAPVLEVAALASVDTKAAAVAKASSQTTAPKPEPQAVYAAPSATRLLVEQGAGGGAFVYKLISRATGQLLSEFPREAAKSLADQASYRAGAIIDESA